MDVRQGFVQHWKTYKEECQNGMHRHRFQCFHNDDFPVLESYMRRAYPPDSKILLWHRRIDQEVSWWLRGEGEGGNRDHNLCRLHDGGRMDCRGNGRGYFF